MKSITVIIIALCTFSFISCAETQQVLQTAGRVQLDGQYTINSVNGIATTGQTITFSGLTQKISGNGGCNEYFADYTLNNLSLNIGEIGSTRKSCPKLDEENELFTALRKVASYNKNDGMLTLYAQNNSVLIQATSN